MAAFCDGHTMFLKDNLQPSVYAQLMTSNQTVATGTYSNLPLLNEGDIK